MVAKVLGSLLLNVITSANTSGLEKTDKAIRKTSSSLKRISKDTGLLGKLSGKLFGGFSIYTARNLFNSYLKFEKDIGAMRSRFYAITQDEQQATQEFEYIRKLATDTALDIKKTADSYSIFYSATRKALGPEGTRDVFENWTRVSRVLHLTDHQFERVTYALREMASKGAIYSQDLRMQIGTHVPNAMGLAQKAAEEMGFSGVDWFEKLQKAAKGNVSMTAEFVRRFSRQAGLEFGSPEAFKKAMQQPDALAKRISNIGYNFMIDFSKAGGSYMIVKILQNVSDFLTGIDYYAITDNLGKIARIIGDIFQYIPQIFTVLKDIALSVAIFYGLRALLSTLKFFKAGFYAFKSGGFVKVLQWLILKFGGEAGKSIVKSMISGTFKNSFRSVIASVLGVSGPLGWLFSALMFLPEIASIFKWVKGKIANWIGVKKETDLLNFYGVNAQSVSNVLERIKNKGPLSTQDLQKQLAFYESTKDIAHYAEYTDKGTINFNFNGVNISEDRILELSDKASKNIIKNKREGFMSMFQKPSQNQGVKLKF